MVILVAFYLKKYAHPHKNQIYIFVYVCFIHTHCKTVLRCVCYVIFFQKTRSSTIHCKLYLRGKYSTQRAVQVTSDFSFHKGKKGKKMGIFSFLPSRKTANKKKRYKCKKLFVISLVLNASKVFKKLRGDGMYSS